MTSVCQNWCFVSLLHYGNDVKGLADSDSVSLGEMIVMKQAGMVLKSWMLKLANLVALTGS